MKGIIIYSGKYGATRQYADWLSKEINMPVCSSDEIGGSQLARYEVVILGSSVYFGKLTIRKWISANLRFLDNKKIYLFQVAGSPPVDIKKRMEYNRSSLPSTLLNSIETFFLPGRMTISRLSWRDRFMLKMGARLTKEADEKRMMLSDYDEVKIENLRPFINKFQRVGTAVT